MTKESVLEVIQEHTVDYVDWQWSEEHERDIHVAICKIGCVTPEDYWPEHLLEKLQADGHMKEEA